MSRSVAAKQNKEETTSMKTELIPYALSAAVVVGAFAPAVQADEVTDWNAHMLNAVLTARVGAAPAARVTAMVQSAVYDAVNGVYKQYAPVHVPAAAPPGASARAAAVQAAHGVLVKQFAATPAIVNTLNTQRSASLASLDSDGDGVFGKSVERGLAWGQYVADEIWSWRSADGFSPAPPAFNGLPETGVWRPTPPAFASGATPQLAYTVPFVIDSVENFLPPGPNALGSVEYAIDYNEVKAYGKSNSALRTADQTLLSTFWAGNTPGFWNRAAVEMTERYDLSLLEKARVLAAMNTAVSDAVFSCWSAKYSFVTWRPVTAIPLADTDGNDGTIADAGWLPWLTTPNHPEYPSGHSSQSGAAAGVLAAFFGDANDFALTSETTPGVSRNFSSFDEAAVEAGNSRIYGGIHFRKACTDGKALGNHVAEYVLQNAFQRVHGTTHP